MLPPLLSVLLASILVSMTTGYKQVVFMHGILSGPGSFDYYQSLVEKEFPGIQTTNIDMYNDLFSLEEMWTQVNTIAEKVKPILTNRSSEGTILICYSQGGLICRGLLSVLDHNVVTFIALSSPLAGQFGDTDYLRLLFPTLLRDTIYKFFYTPEGQIFSIANYWFDPRHQDLFANSSLYLGLINNQTTRHNADGKYWRSNFSKLKNLVLIGGPDDGVIMPWQSSQFGMYDKHLNVQPYRSQPWYIDDAFGLKTLDKANSIHLHTVAGVKHKHWHANRTIFETYIKPWLK